MAVFVDAEAFIVGFHFANHARVAIHFLKKKNRLLKLSCSIIGKKVLICFDNIVNVNYLHTGAKFLIFVHLLDLDQIVKFLRSILY